MKRLVTAAVGLTLFAHAGCDSVEVSPGYARPIQAQGAQFFDSPLPGSPPDTTGEVAGPTVTAIELDNTVIYPGATNERASGRVQDDAVAIAIALPTIAPVHWVFPAEGPTPEFPGELTWGTRLSFDRHIAPGLHPLRAVGIDAAGHAGRQYEVELCFPPPYPDNLNACDPTQAPPDMVITLEWDRDADVDLELVDPDGRRIDPKHSVAVAPMGGMVDRDAARLDRDSLRDCAPDGWRRESIAFSTLPTGHWGVFARLFDGCGESSVRYRLTVLLAQGEGTDRHLAPVRQQAGMFVSQYDADLGAGPGTLLVNLDL